MLQAFTRNYQDNSTEAGFQFTFYCDVCNDGHKSSFIESSSYKKGKGIKAISQGASVLGSLLGGRASNIGWSGQRAGDILAERFEGRSPEWQREHEQAFERAQNEVRAHYHRCPNCNKYACDQCHNEDTGLCTSCSPRQEVYVAQAHSQAMKRNIDEKSESATVWSGELTQKTTMCSSCGKPAGTGKFCNNCGASLDLKSCPSCGTKNSQTVKFCNNCGANLSQPASVKCTACGFENSPGTKFCGNCGKPA
ncbi:MAG: zinc ribbon domain-containing protein [Ruminococcus sp.]|jgi:ribosomal protein L37E|nr:zinc ribbon domain-containing protein [Ruminococcus sp.]